MATNDTLTWLDAEAFQTASKDGTLPEHPALRKYYTADDIKAVDGANRTLRFVISTDAVDRDRDTIEQSGWRLDNYLQNPVVLWAHSHSQLPVAKTTRIEPSSNQLIAEAEFASAELNPFADTVFRMLQQGFLRGVSVGFRPLSHAFNDERRGVDFTEQELLEFSVVPVPANAEALMSASSAGIDIEPLKEWAKGVLGLDDEAWRKVKAMSKETKDVPDTKELDADEAKNKDADPSVIEMLKEQTGAILEMASTICQLGSEIKAYREAIDGRSKAQDDKPYIEIEDDPAPELNAASIAEFMASDEGRETVKQAFQEAVDAARGKVT